MEVRVNLYDGKMLKGFHIEATPLEMMTITSALSDAADNKYWQDIDRDLAESLAEDIKDAVRKVDVK